MKTLLPIIAVFLLSACEGSTSAKIVALCKPPVEIPERALSDQEIEIYWGRDRTELRSCGDKLATVQAVNE